MRHSISRALTFTLVFAVGILNAQPTTAPPNAPELTAIDGVLLTGGWRLPETHFVSAKMPMTIVHPRSMPGKDQTNSWARHKKAYPGIEYRIPVSIQGGAYPFYYEIIQGPSWLSIGATVWEDDFGVLHGVAPATPQAAETVVLRVTDQELTEVNIEFPLTVTRNDFVFVDPNTIESGDGTIDSPLKRFSELHGDYYPGSGALGNSGTTAYSGKIVYLRGGVHQVADIPTPYILWSSGRPQVLLGYPGEGVELHMTNGAIRSVGADFFFSGITNRYSPDLNLVEGGHWSEAEGRKSGSNSWLHAYDNSWSMENGSRMFWFGSNDRLTFFEWSVIQHRGINTCSTSHPELRSAGNHSVVYSSAKKAGSYNNYVTVWGTRTQDQDGSLLQLYSTRYGVAEDNAMLPDSGGPLPTASTAFIFMKQQNPFWSVRRNRWTEHALNTSGGGALYLNTTNRSGHTDSSYVEAAYNLVHSVGNHRGRTINYNQSGLALESYADDHHIWIYRNTFIGSMHGFARPYTVAFENNVLILGQGTSSSHAEGQYPVSSPYRTVVVGDVGIIDGPETWQKYLGPDYRLRGDYREALLGIVGHEISMAE